MHFTIKRQETRPNAHPQEQQVISVKEAIAVRGLGDALEQIQHEPKMEDKETQSLHSSPWSWRLQASRAGDGGGGGGRGGDWPCRLVQVTKAHGKGKKTRDKRPRSENNKGSPGNEVKKERSHLRVLILHWLAHAPIFFWFFSLTPGGNVHLVSSLYPPAPSPPPPPALEKEGEKRSPQATHLAVNESDNSCRVQLQGTGFYFIS